MRLCLWTIVFHTPRQSVRKCAICRTSQFIPLSSQIRGYSNIVKDPDQNDNSLERVQSTGTLSDDPEIITAESPETQQPQSSPIPPPHPPSTTESRPVKPPIHFRTVEPQKGRRGLLDLQKAMKETSLRRRLGWSNPLLGVNPAYDMAIAFLTQDRKEKIRIIKHLENRITHERRNGGDVKLIRQLENARYQQFVFRDINVPEVRWRFKQGDIDLRTPIHQYLYRQNWSNGVYVGKLMQRLTTMKILPDSLPALTPKVDFRLRFNEKKFPSRIRKRERGWRDTEAGELLSSKVLQYPPRMEIIPHYKEWWLNRKYTVVMLDLDVPDVSNDSFQTKLHWMVKDIVASPVKTIIPEGNGKTVVPYLPPHPFRGMKYHRYPIFVFEQPSEEVAQRQQSLLRQQIRQQPKEIDTVTTNTEGIKISPLLTIPSTTGTTLRTYSTNSKSPTTIVDRDNFYIRKWANSMGMKPVGAHLVRCEWDEHVPVILESLGLKERAFKKIKSQETSIYDFPRNP